MYVVPLSSMVGVVKTKDSSSIYLPWAVGSVLCSACWAIYGLFGVHDVSREGGREGGKEGRRNEAV